MVPQPAFVLDISEYWEKKRRPWSVTGASSSRAGRGPPTLIERLRDQAAFWGWSIGVRYGEPFAAGEPIGLSGLAGIV